LRQALIFWNGRQCLCTLRSIQGMDLHRKRNPSSVLKVYQAYSVRLAVRETTSAKMLGGCLRDAARAGERPSRGRNQDGWNPSRLPIHVVVNACCCPFQMSNSPIIAISRYYRRRKSASHPSEKREARSVNARVVARDPARQTRRLPSSLAVALPLKSSKQPSPRLFRAHPRPLKWQISVQRAPELAFQRR
jgi:hypothetical protein